MLVARSYECPGCGGLVREAARVCNYCRAPIATVRCGRCFTMSVPEALHCINCGAELGLQPVEMRPAVDAQCPRCTGQRLDAFLGVDGQIFDCASCGGQFVALEVLQAMVRRHESSAPGAHPGYRARNPMSEPIKYVHCPICGDLMLRKNFGKTSGVVVDVCAKHGTWFDVGELAHVLSFVCDGGLQRAAAFGQNEQERLRTGELVHLPQPAWSPIHDSERPLSWDWTEMRDAARAFVGWVRAQLK